MYSHVFGSLFVENLCNLTNCSGKHLISEKLVANSVYPRFLKICRCLINMPYEFDDNCCFMATFVHMVD